jgi:hypothetical protein
MADQKDNVIGVQLGKGENWGLDDRRNKKL